MQTHNFRSDTYAHSLLLMSHSCYTRAFSWKCACSEMWMQAVFAASRFPISRKYFTQRQSVERQFANKNGTSSWKTMGDLSFVSRDCIVGATERTHCEYGMQDTSNKSIKSARLYNRICGKGWEEEKKERGYNTGPSEKCRKEEAVHVHCATTRRNWRSSRKGDWDYKETQRGWGTLCAAWVDVHAVLSVTIRAPAQRRAAPVFEYNALYCPRHIIYLCSLNNPPSPYLDLRPWVHVATSSIQTCGEGLSAGACWGYAANTS